MVLVLMVAELFVPVTIEAPEIWSIPLAEWQHLPMRVSSSSLPPSLVPLTPPLPLQSSFIKLTSMKLFECTNCLFQSPG